ncbi:hypothetical protein ANN_22627 [Periplaneta americana]|uniref:Uncharacterized protein n=1 Tax=Periplaneta americana TaxID=6978 RepID=A0ABQ8S947_PERAM|nr:hypothetical protein ANN_22627 [Periplaneta americana]
MVGLCEGGNEPPGSLKASKLNQKSGTILWRHIGSRVRVRQKEGELGERWAGRRKLLTHLVRGKVRCGAKRRAGNLEVSQSHASRFSERARKPAFDTGVRREEDRNCGSDKASAVYPEVLGSKCSVLYLKVFGSKRSKLYLEGLWFDIP